MANNIFEKIKQEASPFEIFPGQKDFHYVNNISHGSYGIVNKVICKQYLAMKVMDIRNISQGDGEPFEKSLENAYKEYSIMKKNVKNVVRAHNCFYSANEKKFYFTMDIMEGTLASFMQDLGKSLKFEEFLPKFQDMVTGIKFQKPSS